MLSHCDISIFRFIILVIATVICLQPSMYFADRTYTIVNGSINRPCTFYLKIYSEQFVGVILSIIDSSKAHLTITMKQGAEKDMLVYLKFKQNMNSLGLRKLCGCKYCHGSMIDLYLQINSSMITLTCNSKGSLHLLSSGNYEADVILPKELSIGTEQMYITIGNIGRYVGANNADVPPTRPQMVGCVEKFLINGETTKLMTDGSKVNSHCPRGCTNNACNGGICKGNYTETPSCDCGSTARNGPHCNNELRLYSRGVNTTYEKVPGSKEIHLKMSWLTKIRENYCIMELLLSRRNVTVFLNGSRLMADSTTIAEIKERVANFITVDITKDYVIVKSGNSEEKKTSFAGVLNKVNIGFVDVQRSCETLNGTYDLHYNDSEWRIGKSKSISATASTDVVTSDRGYGIPQPIVFGLITAGCLLIFTAVIVTLYLRSRREFAIHIQKVEAISNFSLDNHSRVFHETWTYGKVADNCDYEYIQDNTGIYGTVDN